MSRENGLKRLRSDEAASAGAHNAESTHTHTRAQTLSLTHLDEHGFRSQTQRGLHAAFLVSCSVLTAGFFGDSTLLSSSEHEPQTSTQAALSLSQGAHRQDAHSRRRHAPSEKAASVLLLASSGSASRSLIRHSRRYSVVSPSSACQRVHIWSMIKGSRSFLATDCRSRFRSLTNVLRVDPSMSYLRWSQALCSLKCCTLSKGLYSS